MFAWLLLCIVTLAAAAELDLGRFRNTHYYVALERDYTLEPKDQFLLSMEDQVLAQVSSAYKHALSIEGTGRLVNEKIITFAGRKEGEIRYFFSRSEYGLGVGGCALKPFHTIAVDPTKIPLGAVVQIQETVGMLLPDGSRHDGLWRAEDIGSAIQGDHIDLFVGNGDQGEVLRRAGILNLQPLTVKMIEAPKPRSCVHEERW